MTKAVLFKVDKELTSKDYAFENSIYMTVSGAMEIYGVRDCAPNVICSPRRTGKTTQLNHIHERQKIFSENNDVNYIPIDVKTEGLSEDDLKKWLKKELKSEESGTLVDIIQTSRAIQGDSRRKILAITKADNLHIDALRWILININHLKRFEHIHRNHNIQVIVDGSFAVDTLTQGPNSEIPMPAAIYPREFNAEQQEHFVKTRLDFVNLDLSPHAYKALWQATLGDKYFTQALCLRMAEGHAPSSAQRIIGDQELGDLIKAYIDEGQGSDPLKRDLLRTFAHLSEEMPDKEYDFRKLLKNIDRYWDTMTRDIRSLAYKGGLIRRKNFQEVMLRAPLIYDIYLAAEDRAEQVRTVMDCKFTLDGVAPAYRDSAHSLVKDIIENAYCNSIVALHVGYGHKLNDTQISVDAVALNRGEYKGTWEVRTPNIRVDDEVWCIMWSWDSPDGVRTSQVRPLPVSASTDDHLRE